MVSWEIDVDDNSISVDPNATITLHSSPESPKILPLADMMSRLLPLIKPEIKRAASLKLPLEVSWTLIYLVEFY